MNGVESAENGPIMDGDVPGALGCVGDHDIISDMAVVGQVDVGHDEAAGADRGLIRRGGPAIDGRVLADDGPLPDLDPGLLAIILEILGVATQDRAITNDDILGQAYVAAEGGARADAAAIAHGDLWPHHGKGADRYAGTELGRAVDQSGRMYRRAHRSTTRAIISASATTCPST